MVGKIERVKLRDVYPHEALDFTRWLEENIDVLNDALDITLVNVEREQNAGTFNVDLVAEDEAGNTVIIENQLEKSNHDHLGKLITYLTALDANTAIWIVSNARPEHIKAISWLNESSDASFYLIKIEAIKIGESDPAPLLTLIVGPSKEAKDVGATKKEIAERYHIRYKFWEQLLELAKTKTKLHSGISPGRHGWIGTGAGVAGLNLVYVVRQHDVQVELYIDRDKESGKGNKEIFDAIKKNEDQIEKEFGTSLVWERLDQKRASRIRKPMNIGGYRDEEDNWPDIHKKMIDCMVNFEKALRPYIKRLKV